MKKVENNDETYINKDKTSENNEKTSLENEKTYDNNNITRTKNEKTQNFEQFTQDFKENYGKNVVEKELNEAKTRFEEKEAEISSLERKLYEEYSGLFDKQFNALKVKESAIAQIEEKRLLETKNMFLKAEISTLQNEIKILRDEIIHKDNQFSKEKTELLSSLKDFKSEITEKIIQYSEKSNDHIIDNLEEMMKKYSKPQTIDFVQLIVNGIVLIKTLTEKNPDNSTIDALKNDLKKAYNELDKTEKLRLRNSIGGLLENFLK